MEDQTNSIARLLLTDKTVFTVEELAYIWDISSDATLRDKIKYLVAKGNLLRIKRGYFAVRGREYDINELANKLVSPSYISFETVLTQAGVNFQYSSEIYLASNNTKTVRVGDKTFVYKKIKDEILYNQTGIIKEKNYFIATPERAFLDTLYLNKDRYFDNERPIDYEKCLIIGAIYGEKTLIKEIENRIKDAGSK